MGTFAFLVCDLHVIFRPEALGEVLGEAAGISGDRSENVENSYCGGVSPKR